MVELHELSVGIDMVVHSASKLLGHLGNPEYGKGVLMDSLSMYRPLLEEAENLDDDTEEQLKACLKV